MNQKKDESIYKIIQYGKWLIIFFFAFSCSTILFQILRDVFQKDYIPLYSYGLLALMCILTCVLFTFFYVLEKYYKHRIHDQKISQLLRNIHMDTYEKSLGILKNQETTFVQDEKYICHVEDTSNWKIHGLETYIRVAKENLHVFCDDICENSGDCDEGIELLLFEKLTDRLLQDMHGFSLSGIDIRLIINKLESILLSHKYHRYDNYISQLDIEEQLRIQLLICDESFELLCETMKERFQYIPSDFSSNLVNTISALEEAIEKENAYAQFDFANICFSSDDYQAMDIAIELLYKAQKKHPGAKDVIQRLQNA